MTVTLKPGLEEEIAARARAAGLSTEEFVNRELERLVANTPPVLKLTAEERDLTREDKHQFHQTVDPEEWDAALDELIQSSARRNVSWPVDDSRESIYREREDAQL